MGNVNTFLQLYDEAYIQHTRNQFLYGEGRRRSGIIPVYVVFTWTAADTEWRHLNINQRRQAIQRNPYITWRYNV